MKLKASKRAFGNNGGASGGGWEPTDPDYEHKRLARLKRDYLEMSDEWRDCFLGGLNRFERDWVTGRRKE